MSHLITCQSVSKSFGAQRLFKDITVSISEGERLGIIGPNGAGKSTLLKIFAQMEEQDEGNIFLRKQARLVYLSQAENFDPQMTIRDSLLEVVKVGEIVDSARFAQVQKLAGRCGFFDLEQQVENLSGGWLKRLAICRALIQSPDVLLMDEPTNHLDLEGILWLEGLLANASFAFALVSHDRYFLDNVSNRVIELNCQYPGGYLAVQGSFQEFLRRKEELLGSQGKKEVVLDNKLRREIEWLSRGPKARTTKARYRIDDAKRLKDEHTDIKWRNAQNKRINIGFDSTNRKTKKLLTAKNLSVAYGENIIFSGLDLQLTPGVCVGVLGNNGSGKTTFMKVIAGLLPPDQGTVKEVDGLQKVLFDQKRAGLDQDLTLRKSLVPDGDSIIYKGRPLHVASWAKRFLFRPDQLDMPTSSLSGGEQARILIANLMKQQADVLLLDEPTNDLDIPSLNVLEDGLSEFPGAIVLVSHDRFLLDRLADFVIGFDGKGDCQQFADYRQWLEWISSRGQTEKQQKNKPTQKSGSKKKKITLGERLELEGIEEKIAQAEGELEACHADIERPELQAEAAELQQCCLKLQGCQEKVDALYRRWEELEEKAS